MQYKVVYKVCSEVLICLYITTYPLSEMRSYDRVLVRKKNHEKNGHLKDSISNLMGSVIENKICFEFPLRTI